MRTVLKTLQKEPCRVRDISDNEKQSFSNYSHLQRYYPALDMFTIPDNILSYKNIELPSKYTISEWISKDTECPKIWKAIRTSTDNISETCNVFTKVIHLLNPIDILKERYTCPEHPLIPQSDKTWKKTLNKIHSRNNQAYVDAIANFILSHFRELDLTPHCVFYYGCYSGISNSYQFNISNEYDTYRQCRWFWKGLQKHFARLTLINNDTTIINDPKYEEFRKEIITCPLDDDSEIEIDLLSDVDVDINDTESIKSITFDTIENDVNDTLFEINKNPKQLLQSNNDDTLSIDDIDSINTDNDSSHSENDSSESESENDDSSYGDDDSSDDDNSDDDSETIELDVDICLEMPNMPVIIITQEAQEGVMDNLLDEDEIDGSERGSQSWETKWIAWIFQIIAVLTFLQHTINFTHNDLHSNNVIWRKTDKKFIYYKVKNGTVWRIPTFGKIFSIIDFGRAIFRLGKNLWISDDHWPEQDAGDQYNFGPFYDKNKPKVEPNPSFDLCRLSISLIDGLFDEKPPKKKGKSVKIMSEEGSWKVYETRSQLYNLLWSWTVDDAGRTVHEDKYGDEKYDGFELYIRIAQDVHNAIPKEQLYHPVYQQFIWKNKVPQNEKIYNLGV